MSTFRIKCMDSGPATKTYDNIYRYTKVQEGLKWMVVQAYVARAAKQSFRIILNSLRRAILFLFASKAARHSNIIDVICNTVCHRLDITM